MHDDELMQGSFKEYLEPETNKFFMTSAEVEGLGYCVWPRVKETAEFCKRMGYKKIGMAFCAGLRAEAKVVARILREYGLEVSSVICKTGAFPKSELNVPKEWMVRGGAFEPICNPVAQARILNKEKTEFNILVGLCVGHDSLVTKHSDAMVTTLLVKDRALGNNPVQSVYCADMFFKKRLMPEQ